MRRVSVTELKNKLSQYLRLVKRGEVIEICDRKVPIARIESLGHVAAGHEDRLNRLVKDGVVTRAKDAGGDDPLRLPPIPCAADPVKALIEERGDR